MDESTPLVDKPKHTYYKDLIMEIITSYIKIPTLVCFVFSMQGLISLIFYCLDS